MKKNTPKKKRAAVKRAGVKRAQPEAIDILATLAANLPGLLRQFVQEGFASPPHAATGNGATAEGEEASPSHRQAYEALHERYVSTQLQLEAECEKLSQQTSEIETMRRLFVNEETRHKTEEEQLISELRWQRQRAEAAEAVLRQGEAWKAEVVAMTTEIDGLRLRASVAEKSLADATKNLESSYREQRDLVKQTLDLEARSEALEKAVAAFRQILISLGSAT